MCDIRQLTSELLLHLRRMGMFEQLFGRVTITEVDFSNSILRQESFKGSPHKRNRGCSIQNIRNKEPTTIGVVSKFQ